jgi:hypothetical protein
MRNLIYVVCSLILIGIGLGMVMGKVQEVIYFEDPLNEMLFTILMFVASLMVLSNLELKSK